MQIRAIAYWVFACLLAFAPLAPAKAETLEKATFAGGCFWCMEAEFAELAGVRSVVSGYTGGTVANPTYAQVSSGTTGHLEAVEVTFDAEQVSYEKLLGIFWDNVDPFDDKGQFCDKGSQYLAGIFTHGEAQAQLAQASKARIEKKHAKPVATLIREASVFYPAEEHHQQYYKKNSVRYTMYKTGCGRSQRLEQLKEPR